MSARRSILVWGLVSLATLLTLVASLTVWSKRQLLDTDNWTASSSRLLADDQVRAALSTKLVDVLYQRVDVTAELRQQLPDNAQGAAPVVAGALQAAAVRVTDAFLATARAQALWEQANRRMHAALVDVLEGKEVAAGRVSTLNGAVTLDLRPMLQRVAARLGVAERLKERADPSTGQIVILRSSQLQAAQDAVRVLRVLTVFLAVVVLVLYALAIYLARGRRRTTLMVSGGTLVFVGLVLAVVRRMVGNAIVDSIVNTQANRPAVRTIWLIETDLLRDIALALIVYGIVALVAGFLAGPSRLAVATRRTLAPTFRARPVAVYAVVVALFLILLAWGPAGEQRRLLGTVLLIALLLTGVEVWRRQMLREFPEGTGSAGATAPLPPTGDSAHSLAPSEPASPHTP